MTAAYIVSAVRTPMGKFGGSLKDFSAADLGVIAARAALERAGVEAGQVDEVIFGCARQAGGGPNVARQVAVRALGPVLGTPVPAFTVNQACASGLQSLALAAERLAEEYKIPREEQDRYAARSHLRAAAAWQAGRFRDEVVPVKIEEKKGKRVL